MTPHGEIVVAFASTLAKSDFATAHDLLAPELRTRLTPAVLSEKLHAMFGSRGDARPTGIHYDERFLMTDWPGKEPRDVGWAHVSILSDAFVEAIEVTIAEVDG